MLKARYIYLHILACLCICYNVNADDKTNLKNINKADTVAASGIVVSLDPPYAEGQLTYEKLNYSVTSDVYAKLRLRLYQQRDTGYASLYNLVFYRVCLKEGAHTLTLALDENEELIQADYDFLGIMKRFELLPPGVYTAYVDMYASDNNILVSYHSQWNIDSTLAHNTGIRTQVNSILAGSTKPLAAGKARPQGDRSASPEQLSQLSKTLNRRLGRNKGIAITPEFRNGKSYHAFYYKKWFLGRYEIVAGDNMQQKILKEQTLLKTNPAAFVNNEWEHLTSVSSQVKKLYKKDKKEEDISANIELAGYFSSGQPYGSQQDNNYQEVSGSLGTKIMDIPVQIEGYYTTQDKGRVAKASYIRLHYDVTAAKSGLTKTIEGYKQQFNQADARGKGMVNVYKEVIANLQGDNKRLLQELRTQYNIDGNQLLQDETIISQLQEDTGVSNTVNDAREKQAAAKGKYQLLKDNQQKIEKYSKQIEQFSRQQYLDSVINYNEIDKLGKQDEASYRKMAKAASNLLPEGKASRFITGLTKFDIGILNAYESSYTMNGQTLKGGSIGYEIGNVQTSLSIGKTEYISRDGQLDRYNTYLGRIDYKPFKNHDISLLYYTYAPTRQMTNDEGFFKSDAALQSFSTPTHIISYMYSGQIISGLQVQSEGAVSKDRAQTHSFISMDNTALKNTVSYSLPRSSATLKAEWEHLGDQFKNNALPYIKTATERYTLSAQSGLFKSFVTVGIQYNFLQQENFSTTGKSTKWGFDIRTHSKQYPTVYLSYKPYSTFRTYNDTLSIPQRPVIGEVWILRSSYQMKKRGASHRFSAMYNMNNSDMDTLHYRMKTVQLGYIYMEKAHTLNINGGYMSVPVSGEGNTGVYFLNSSVSRKINKLLDVSLLQEIGWASFGLQKNGTGFGVRYLFKRWPVSVRMQVKYSYLKQSELINSMHIWAAMIGVQYRFTGK